jgi:hypothetical protein
MRGGITPLRPHLTAMSTLLGVFQINYVKYLHKLKPKGSEVQLLSRFQTCLAFSG